MVGPFYVMRWTPNYPLLLLLFCIRNQNEAVQSDRKTLSTGADSRNTS